MNQVLLDHVVFQGRWEIKVLVVQRVHVDPLVSVVFPDPWVQWVNLVWIVIWAKLRFV